MSRRIPARFASVVTALAVSFLLAATPALAASSSHNSPKLPGGDYIQTNIWLGNMPWNTFNAQSSTWVIGNNPYYPYLTEDAMTVNVNGISITVTWPPSADWSSLSSATFVCDETYTGYCGNAVYNITFDSGIWWNNTGSDYSKTILYANTQPFYNHASVTNWCC